MTMTSRITWVKMWIGSFTSLYFFIVVNTQEFHTTELVIDLTSETPDSLYKSRCTRRFTPGVCEEPVTTVWSFVFHLQNCTERLGCRLSHRTNRFRSYRQCMKRCRPLIDMYLQMLASENYTNLFYLRNQAGGKIGRREGDSPIELNGTLPDIGYEEDKDDEEGSASGEPLFNLYYRDEYDGDVSVPPDIDYVGQREEDVPSIYLYED